MRDVITGITLRSPVFFSKSDTFSFITPAKASSTACSLGRKGTAASKSSLQATVVSLSNFKPAGSAALYTSPKAHK
ncbi:hypothetical protein Barb6_01020 [Bacteroidales bacterium Barb6]|nr:hypothetical protein Barb6_01020 [Bacteroidales bacterium Barb6]